MTEISVRRTAKIMLKLFHNIVRTAHISYIQYVLIFLVITRTRHVGNVGSDRLDLVQEYIANPTAIL